MQQVLDAHVRRLRAEYLEMPGLKLTRPQVERLCGLDTVTCEAALSALVEIGFLRVATDGRYVRCTDGPAAPLATRMAKAHLPAAHHTRRTG
jgi:hypothetical protein